MWDINHVILDIVYFTLASGTMSVIITFRYFGTAMAPLWRNGGATSIADLLSEASYELIIKVASFPPCQ